MSLKPNLGNAPDLLCIGPQRCGTTWIYCNLRKNPYIHTIVSKEIHYFDPFYIPWRKDFHEYRKNKARKFLGVFKYIPSKLGQAITHNLSFIYKDFSYVEKMYWDLSIPKDPNDEWYQSLFKGAKKGQITVDYTASYCMLKQDGISHILKVNPNVKILLIIRDPIERAVSHYKMVQEKNNFEISQTDLCIKAADKKGFIYQQSDYAAILDEWLPRFETNKIKILFYDDLKKDSVQYLKSICDFADIELTKGMIDSATKRVYPTKTELTLDKDSKEKLSDLFEPTIASLIERFPDRAELFKTWQQRYK